MKGRKSSLPKLTLQFTGWLKHREKIRLKPKINQSNPKANPKIIYEEAGGGVGGRKELG